MMRKVNLNLLIYIVFGISSVCLLGGCTDDESVTKETEFVFRLSLPGRVDVTTRTPVLSKISIKDVWVVQFSAESKLLLRKKNFSGSKADGGAIGEPENNESIINVTTSEFSNVKSNFYIIVNAGTTFLNDFSGNEADLMGLTLAISPGVSDEPTLLTTGPLEYTPAAPGTENAGKVILVAPLKRAFARVILKWEKSTTCKGVVAVTGVKAYSLPTKMALYARGGGLLSSTYPDVADLSTGAVTIGSGALIQSSTRTFYMAENLRGTGTATSFADKNIAANGPGGNLTGCTRLVLEADYTYPGATAPIKLEYSIYLGGNLMNDYNIQRGYEYNLTVQISGANSGDVRVTITNGNVVVFDDVDTISKTVEFR